MPKGCVANNMLNTAGAGPECESGFYHHCPRHRMHWMVESHVGSFDRNGKAQHFPFARLYH